MVRPRNVAIGIALLSAIALAALVLLLWPDRREVEDVAASEHASKASPTLEGRAGRLPLPANPSPSTGPPPLAPASPNTEASEITFVEGRVVDLEGRGVEGLPIVERIPRKDPETKKPNPLAWSGVDGAFSFQRPLRIAWIGVGESEGWLSGDPMYLPLAPSPLLLRVQPSRRVRGIVLDHRGNPVQNVRVLAYAGSDVVAMTPDTPEDGRFTLNVPRDAQPIQLVGLPAAGPVAGAESVAHAEFGLPTQSPDEVVLRFRPEAAISGIIVGPDGEPVAYGNVSASSAERIDPIGHMAPIDPRDGSFRLPNLLAGPTWIFARPADPSLGTSDPLRVDAPAAGVKVRCPAAHLLEGRLDVDDTAGFLAVWVRRFPGSPYPVQEEARVRPDGTFAIGRVSDGDTLLYVYRPGDARYAWIERVRPDASHLVVHLREGSLIRGHALAPDGGGIQGVEVGLQWNGPFLRFASGPDGSFTIPGLPLGKYRLVYRCSGRPVEVLKDEVEAGAYVAISCP